MQLSDHKLEVPHNPISPGCPCLHPARGTNVRRLNFCPPLGTRFGAGEPCTFRDYKSPFMKKTDCEVRKKRVMMRMNKAEYDMLHAFYKKSTCRQLSEYLRKIALQKPVIIKYRNESADEILSALLKLKKEFNAIGNNFNQAVHKLHTLDRIPEFRSWLAVYDKDRQAVVKKLEEIQKELIEIYRPWSQK
jgi:hypothetical protein